MASSDLGRDQHSIEYVGDVPYYIAIAGIHSGLDNNGYTGPCTIIPYKDPTTADYIQDVIATFTAEDDVWTPDFLAFVVFEWCPNDMNLAEDVLGLLRKHGMRDFSYRCKSAGRQHLPWGPYWIKDRAIHRVSRLYSDEVDAFVMSTVPFEESLFEYRPLGVAVHGEYNPASLSIAVPSRMYYNRTAELPLAGFRMAVKDNTDLQGVRTGGSSRSFTRLYGPSKRTAPAVKTLLELGAVVVGKTRTTQFADTEWATADWVDFHAPFSPRADGYQNPSGSSAGSGAAMAAFKWLDFATGTDGCGSLRSPAAVEGLFSLRPSHGTTSVEGIIPWGAQFDTFGGLSRDLGILETISSVVYHTHPLDASTKMPSEILYAKDFWPVADESQYTLFNNFIARLEEYTGARCIPIDLDDNWRRNNPIGTDKSLVEYFNNTLPWAYAKTQYQTYLTFQNEYIRAFDQTPYFNPEGQFKISWLPTVTADMHEQAIKELDIFQEWFEGNIIPASNAGESEALLLIPWTTGKPDYRDSYRDRPTWAGYGWFYYMISPFAKAPEAILPIGQTSYRSEVTNREEWLPASIGVIGARGSDAHLLSLLRNMMETAEMQTSVQAGQTAFTTRCPSDTGKLLSQNGLGLKQEQHQ